MKTEKLKITDKTEENIRGEFTGHFGSSPLFEAINLAYNLVKLSLATGKNPVGKVDIYQHGVEGFVITEKERLTVFKWGNLSSTKITIEERRPFTDHEGYYKFTELAEVYPALAIKLPNN